MCFHKSNNRKNLSIIRFKNYGAKVVKIISIKIKGSSNLFMQIICLQN